MKSDRPVNAHSARELVSDALARQETQRKARERADAAKNRALEAAELKQKAAAAHARRLARRVTEAFKASLQRALEAAVEGQTRLEIEHPQTLGNASDDDLAKAMFDEKLRLFGFSVSPGDAEDSLSVEWRRESPEFSDLSRRLNADVLGWVSSTSGQMVLGHLWSSIRLHANRGKTSCSLTVEALTRNEARWGPNQPYRVLVDGKPSGCLLLSPKVMEELTGALGYGCSWRPNEEGPHQLAVSWQGA